MRQYLRVTFLFVMVQCFACSTIEKPKQYEVPNLSNSQTALHEILDRFYSEYGSTKSEGDKQICHAKYLDEIKSLIYDKLGSRLDSFHVTVDAVMENGLLVTTRFHSGKIEFSYGLKFKDSLNEITTRIYQFLRNLKPDSSVYVNFAVAGSINLYTPNVDGPSLLIHAYATPLGTRR